MQISMHDKLRCMLRMHVSPTICFIFESRRERRRARTRMHACMHACTHARTHARNVSVTLAISTARGNTYRPRVNLPRAWAILAKKCRFVICSITLLNRLHSVVQLFNFIHLCGELQYMNCWFDWNTEEKIEKKRKLD